MKKILILLFLSTLNSQTFDLFGKVISKNSSVPVQDVNIIIKGSDLGTASSDLGLFSFLDLEPKKYILILSAIGFKDQFVEIELNENITNLLISLENEPLLSDALDVVGRYPSKHLPYLTDNITNKNISEFDFQTMSELFRNVGGVDVQMEHNNGRNANFSIIGSSDYKPGGYNNRVLVLLDGFQISMPYSGSIDWNAMPLDFLQRVEVVKGPVSSLYGQNSMGGIINLVTKDFENEFYNIKSSVGSFNSKDINLNMSNITDRISYIALVQHKKGDGHRYNAQYEQNNFYTKFLNKKKDLSLSFIANKSINGQPGFSVEERPTLISYRISNRDSVYLQLFKKKPLNKNDNIVFSLSMNNFYTHYHDRGDTPLEEEQEDTFYNDTSLNIRAELQKLLSNSSYLIIGSDIIIEQSDISIYKDIYDNLLQLSGGLFAQNRIEINKKLILGLGLRFDLRSINRGEEYSNKNFSDISPKINLTYKKNNLSTWNLAISKGFRSPSLSEMFLQYESDYGLNTQGNPDLNPEQLYGLDIAYNRSNMKNMLFSFSTFYYRYEDMIDFVYGLPVLALNRSDISSCGFETTANYKINNSLSVNGGYTYLRVNDINDIDPVLYRPRHKFVSSIRYKNGNTTHIVSTKYQSKQDYQDFLSDDREYQGSEIKFPIKQLDALFLINYNGSYNFKKSKVYLKISNIFDQEYELIQDFPMPGRTFSLSYEYSL